MLGDRYEIGEVMSRVDGEDGTTRMKVRISDKHESAFHAEFPAARQSS